MTNTKFVYFLPLLILAACAPSSKDIQAKYTSSLKYENYNCQQLTHEYERIKNSAQGTFVQQDKKADKDAVGVAASLVFWPAMLLTGGGDDRERVAELKGEIEAMKSVAYKKACSKLAYDIDNDINTKIAEERLKDGWYEKLKP